MSAAALIGSWKRSSVFYELIALAGENPEARSAEGIGRLAAQLSTLRQMLHFNRSKA